MKGLSEMLMLVSGFVVAPFMVTFISEFFLDGWVWIPFFVAMLIAGVLYAVGIFKWASLGLLSGIAVYTALLIWYPRLLSTFPPNVRGMAPPF